MVVVRADVHKRTHTVVAVDDVGRIAVTQIRLDGLGQTYYRHKLNTGSSTPEALRCLKRRLVRVVFHHLHTDQQNRTKPCPQAAA